MLSGPTAVAFCGDDLIGAAKALADFAKTHPRLDVRGGLLESAYIDPAGVKALASLPPRDVLIAQLVGTMAAPMTGLVTVLQGTVSGFVRALNQVAEQRRRRRRGVKRLTHRPVQHGFQVLREVN